MNEKPWVKPLESLINDEDSFVVIQKRTIRNIKISRSKEANSNIYIPSEGVDELNRLASFNTNDLDIHGFLYDRCTLDLFREFLPNSYFKSQNMKFTARIIYLLDWFVNSLKDDEMYKASYDSLYLQQFRLISQYNDHNDFDRRYAESAEFCSLPAVEHMAMIREDLENTRTFKNGIKEYDPKDLTKFVVSYVYSVLEKDYDTNRNVNEGTIPDWIMNFTPHEAISMGKTVLDWDEVDDESIFDNDATLLRAFRMIAQYATYPDIDDSNISSLFKEECMKISAIAILSYVHALMSYGIAIYNSFIAEQLKNLWFYPDCIVDYIYSTYQHVRIDEAMIRYSDEIARVAVALSKSSMTDLLIKLETPIPTNKMPYNVPFSQPFCTAPSYPPPPEVVHQLTSMNNHPSLQPSSPNERFMQLEKTVVSLIESNVDLKNRIEKLEALYGSKEQSSFPKSSRGNFCIHNDYVVYVYKNGYPKVNVEHFNSNETAKAIKEWKDDMKKNVSNFNTTDDMIIEYDDGTVMKCRCKLCGEQFVIDRRLIRPNKQ
jgi:hypothetical protein